MRLGLADNLKMRKGSDNGIGYYPCYSNHNGCHAKRCKKVFYRIFHGRNLNLSGWLVKSFLIFLLCCPAFGATWNSQQDGDWSRTSNNADSPWFDGGAQSALSAIPADGDTVNIDTSGEDLIFDVDQSAWATGMTLTIAAGASLTVKDDAGTYYMMLGADLTLNGTMQAGTSAAVPFTGTFTCDFNSGSNSIVIDDTTGVLNLYCAEPTNKYIKLSADEAADQTEISVDTDVSADWSANDWLVFVDIQASVTEDTEEAQIDSMAATPTVTIKSGGGAGGGLLRAKSNLSYIIKRTRNIRLINSTDFAIKNGKNCYIAAEIVDCAWGISGTDDSTIGGTITVDGLYGIQSSEGCTINCCLSTTLLGSTTRGLYLCKGCTVSAAGLVGGFRRGTEACTACVINCDIAGCEFGNVNSNNNVWIGDVIGGNYGFYQCGTITIYGDIGAYVTSLYQCNDIILANMSIGATVGTITSTTCIDNSSSGKAYNCNFVAGTEFANYIDPTFRRQSDYFESFDHNQTTNAYKAWTVGGIVTSQTAESIGTLGTVIWYELACGSTTYPCFRQYETVVLPGGTIEVAGYIRIADAVDHTSYPPFLAIADKFADPLVDSTQSYLDIDYIPEPDGTDATWQSVDVIWANQGDAPRNVIVRMLAKNAAADVDTVWAIAGYQDEISMILSVVRPTNGLVSTSDTATSFTVDFGQATADAYNNMTIQVQDADTGFWEERTITDWTAGRVVTVDTAFSFTPAVDDKARITATSYGGPVDTATIADAVWDELLADHTAEASFGGEVQQIDPNLTLVLADTAEMQADQANGGRLDLIWDAIKAMTDLISIATSTVTASSTTTSFTIGAGKAAADAYEEHIIMVEDADDSNKELRWLQSWTAGRVVTVERAFSFTPDVGDNIWIMGTGYGGYLLDIWQERSGLSPVIDMRSSAGGGGGRTLNAEDDDP